MDAKCKEPGLVVPVVNFNQCEAKGPCVAVCPYDVFEIRNITKEDFNNLSLLGKLKNTVHGGKVSYTTNAEACRACGLCVKACPEHAIKLVAVHKSKG